MPNEEIPREISLKEVEKHATFDDCWIVLFNVVYNVTDFIEKHNGGSEVILEQAGRDATQQFMEVGHPENALSHIQHLLVGYLPDSEKFPWPITSPK